MKTVTVFLLFFLFITQALADEGKVLKYDDHGKIDPFWPLVAPNGTMLSYDADAASTDLVLEGVVVDSGANNLAIINSKVVKVGDQIGVYKVEVITSNSVDLTKGQERLTIKLKKGGI